MDDELKGLAKQKRTRKEEKNCWHETIFNVKGVNSVEESNCDQFNGDQ